MQDYFLACSAYKKTVGTWSLGTLQPCSGSGALCVRMTAANLSLTSSARLSMCKPASKHFVRLQVLRDLACPLRPPRCS